MNRNSGFTLIELMITVAIVAILAAIAIPSYQDYVLRGHIADATQLLSQQAIRMEQYYASNRTYYGAPACSEVKTEDGYFTIKPTCDSAQPDIFTLTAADSTKTFVYTIDQTGTKTSKGWTSTTQNCWAMKRGESC